MDLLNELSIARAGRITSRTLIVDATCLSTDVVGNCVYITGPSAGDVYQVSTADPLDGTNKMPAVGIIVLKPTPTDTTCQVQLWGEMVDVVSGLTPMKPLFVSSSGALSHIIATPGFGQKAYIQSMGVALSTDRMFVTPDFSIIKRIG